MSVAPRGRCGMVWCAAAVFWWQQYAKSGNLLFLKCCFSMSVFEGGIAARACPAMLWTMV